MKTKKQNRFMALALVLCLLVGLLPTTALAEESPEDGIGLNFTNIAQDWQSADGSVVWEYDAQNGSTLTLYNANLRGADVGSGDSYAVRLPDKATVILEGSSTLTGGTTDTDGGKGNRSNRSCGIYGGNGLTIGGSGTLHATGSSVAHVSAGIYAYEGTITIADSAVVIATGGTVDGSGTANGSGAGIYSYQGSIVISGNAQVTAVSRDDGRGGIFSYQGSVAVSGSATVMATGYEGISAENGVTLSGGLIIAQGDSQAMYPPPDLEGGMADLLDVGNDPSDPSSGKPFAVYGAKDTYKVRKTALDLTNSGTDPGSLEKDGYAWDSSTQTLTLKNLILAPTANNADGSALSLPKGAKIVLQGANVIRAADVSSYTHGIYGEGKLEITAESDNGRLFAMGGTSTGAMASSTGLGASDTMTISGGMVTAMGGTAKGGSNGIRVSGNMEVSHGTMTAIGGTADSSTGIDVTENMEVSHGTVTAASGTAKLTSYSIHVIGYTTISGGTVTATGATAANNSTGMYSANMTISGGTVTAAGATATSSRGISCGINFIISGGKVTAASGAATATYPDGSFGIFSANMTISGGTVTAAGGTAASSQGISCGGSFMITGGTVTAAGNYRALYSAPDLSGYARGTVTASESLSGSPIVKYDKNLIDKYKYFHAEQAPAPPTPVTWYTVSASAGKGGTVEPEGEISVRSGDSREFIFAEEPGFWLAALLVDEKALGTEGSSFTLENVKENHTLRGLFLPFEDMDAKSWVAPDVAALYDLDVLLGETETRFAPKNTMTREMLVTTLYRAAGEPELPENLGYPFEDVDARSYYANAVYWARTAGVVYGVDSEHFGVGRNITRQDLACMLYRYASYLEQDVTGRGDLSAFTDGDRISGYAQEAVSWAVHSGILAGKGNQILDPQGSATRAEAAAMLNRFLNLQ